MSVVKSVRGVVVEKNHKKFEDGHEGYFCALLLPDESVLNFWCSKENELSVPEAVDVEGYDDDMAVTLRLQMKVWDGKKKYTVEPAVL